MKKAKKLLALLLALMMVFSLLAACGNDGYVEDDDDDDDDDDEKSSASGNKNNDETKPDGTNPDGTNPEGTIAQKDPDATYPTMESTYPEPTTAPSVATPTEMTESVENTPSEMASTALGATTLDSLTTMCVQVLDSYDDIINIGIHSISDAEGLFYYRDAENYEYVLYIVDSSMYGYFKYAEDASFSADADASSVQEYYDYLFECFSTLTCHGEPEDGFGYTYKSDVSAPCGEATACNVFYEGEYTGFVWIDDATGISVYEESLDGEIAYQVLDIDTSASWIPDFQ